MEEDLLNWRSVEEVLLHWGSVKKKALLHWRSVEEVLLHWRSVKKDSLTLKANGKGPLTLEVSGRGPLTLEVSGSVRGAPLYWQMLREGRYKYPLTFVLFSVYFRLPPTFKYAKEVFDLTHPKLK